MFSQEDPSLKLRTSFERHKAQFKVNSVSLKKALNSFAKFRNRRTRQRFGVRKGHPDNILRRSLLIREQYATYPWPFFSSPPNDAQRAKSRWHERIRGRLQCNTVHVSYSHTL